MKKRGFGAGWWNGFGGKVHDGEKIEEAARREMVEEAGITAQDISQRGILYFTFEGNPDVLEVHVFKVTDFEGKPKESEEMQPQWFLQDAVPYDQMWPDDKYWFPLFLDDKYFRGEFCFSDNTMKLLKYQLEEVLEF
jgi:8-oxo-dGTP diphosphatase/2-hydroxy-dATP diphosphatase